MSENQSNPTTSMAEINRLHQRIMREFDFTLEPILFVPCSKTRPYSKSMSHCFMSAVTRDNSITKVVISDLMGPVPYDFEHLVPDYDIHPNDLRGPAKVTVITLLSAFLSKLRASKIFYLGGKTHYALIKEANKSVGKDLIVLIPKRGIIDYAIYARKMKRLINETYPKPGAHATLGGPNRD